MSVVDRSRLHIPLYRRIQEALRQRIERGDWALGEALPNRRVLCAEFETTRVTLDKAIHALVQEGWLRSAAASGTYVAAPGGDAASSDSAQTRSQVQRTQRVGVVLGRVGANRVAEGDEEIHETAWHNLFFGPLFEGIRDGFAGEPIEVAYVHIEDGDYEAFCRRSTHDGVILVAPSLHDLPALRRLARARVPFVTLALSSQATPEDATLPCVDADNRTGAMLAVRHLLDLGHRRIGLVNLALSHANLHDRMDGYHCALAEAGVTPDPCDLVLGAEYQGDIFEARIDEWLVEAQEAGDLPTALFVCDFWMTLVTLRVLRRHGLRVPEDISIVGFDDPVSAADLTPPLTTVRQPTYRLGRRASSRLVDYLQEGATALPLQGTELLPSELIVRASTCPPRQVGIISLKESIL